MMVMTRDDADGLVSLPTAVHPATQTLDPASGVVLLVRSSASEQLLGAGAHGAEGVDRGLHRGRVDPGGQRLSHLGDHGAAAVQLLASRCRERAIAVEQTGIDQPGAPAATTAWGCLSASATSPSTRAHNPALWPNRPPVPGC